MTEGHAEPAHQPPQQCDVCGHDVRSYGHYAECTDSPTWPKLPPLKRNPDGSLALCPCGSGKPWGRCDK